MKDLSRKATAYVLGAILAGLLITGWEFVHWPPTNLWGLLILSLLASLTLIFKVLGATERTHYNLSFLIYGFTFILLGLPVTIVVILVSNMVEWLWHGYPHWYIQPFNIATYIIAFFIASAIYDVANPSPELFSFVGVAAILLAAAVFILLNHLMVGLVIWLARGQNFRQSGVFHLLPLMIDFTMVGMGVASAWAWTATPYGVAFMLIPLYLIYSTLRVPALERKTELDPKTQLFNAGYFSQALEDELKRANRFRRPISVIMADMDLLRHVNNTYGHLAGDVVLKGIADILKTSVREYDVVARFGGEEFAILLPETDAENASAVGERLRQEIEAASFTISTSVKPIKVTMSIGISGREDAAISAQELVHRADLALYEAKASGRNCTRVFGQQSRSARPEPHANGSPSEPAQVTATLFSRPQAGVEEKEMPSVAAKDENINKGTGGSTPRRSVNLYIGAVAAVATLLALLLQPSEHINWPGICLFALLAIAAEMSALEIYIKDTSVSTSVVPLVAGTLLFGPAAAVILGLAAAVGATVKHRTRPSRFIFNAGNFTIGNLLVVGGMKLIGRPFTTWDHVTQAALSILFIAFVFLSTTLLLSIVMRLQMEQSLQKIWKERFRWLVPYYLTMGIVVYALVFSYQLAGLIGIFVILVPLLLLRLGQKQYIIHTRELVRELRQKNQELSNYAQEITLLNEEMLLTLAHSIDLRDPHVMEHSRNVARYAVLVAEELGLSPERIENIHKAGLLHDIGKLGIPESVLFKPECLSKEEYEQVKRHVDIGAELIEGCHSLRPLIPFVRYHHERFDGRGYPEGLAGDLIPLEARILCLADAVEAMASDRPYSRARTADEILAEIRQQAGQQFDPEVCEAFCRVVAAAGKKTIVNSARAVLARQMSSEYTTPARARLALQPG